MLLLFSRSASRFKRRQWLAIWAVMLVVEGMAVGAYAFWPAPQGIDIDYTTPGERCLVRGVESFEARGEWPTTNDGRDARAVILSSCAVDLEPITAATKAREFQRGDTVTFDDGVGRSWRVPFHMLRHVLDI